MTENTNLDAAGTAATSGRRNLLVIALVVVTVFALAAGALAFTVFRTPDHEVWVLDQGTDRIAIYDSAHELVATIDVSPAALRRVNPDFDPESGVTVPHMIEFDSENRYAFIPGTAGGVTMVIDAEAREVVAALETGAGSHMAAVMPNDDGVWVAVIGAKTMVEIPLDLDADEPVFEIGRTVDMEELLTSSTNYEWPSFSPVCHQYNGDGSEAWITMGPGIAQGGLFVFDTETAEVVHAYDPAEIRANCGVALSDDESQMLVNWSGVFGEAAGGDDQDGVWYAFDVDSKEVVVSGESSRGVDAHGLRLNPREGVYWQVNRGSDNGIVIDEDTLEVVDEFDAGDSPDILDFSPDGSLAYISQRGPVPRSGDPHVATGENPGVIVVDTSTFEIVTELIPAYVEFPEGHERAGQLANDVHGVGVRLTTGNERTVVAGALLDMNLAAGSFCVLEGHIAQGDSPTGAGEAPQIGG